MSIKEQLNSELKEAMKAKDKEKLTVIRGLKAQITNAEVANNNQELTDEQVGQIVLKEIKQINESITEFKKGNRDDLVADQENKLKLTEVYAPAQMSEDEVSKVVSETIAEVGAESMADFGKVMGAIMPKVKGKADGNVINKLVKEQLQS
ncbi:GatB/YqeY domain-containing protein [Lentilactobacillus sp. SPB1-3]|uniref:GatB/YqeY domain-containing protein n=1 Tax=Lentilactobacillus terminaliae TaxID=3003483 RepID=A0ACD5DC47_9LACO|nr:GatB/YqeY domain-containing protein [Lentilactobacillus sp. SPB1-3]MCZ0977279.1 GatB/YqeY domain-containing protein [Lentilactobacillus sp. SPB1-3]